MPSGVYRFVFKLAVEIFLGKNLCLMIKSVEYGAVVGPKGWAVRPLKRYASWVQNVVRQFGPYPAWA